MPRHSEDHIGIVLLVFVVEMLFYICSLPKKFLATDSQKFCFHVEVLQVWRG